MTGKADYNLTRIEWNEIPGWAEDDHCAAFRVFCVSAQRMRLRPYSTKKIGVDAGALAAVAQRALQEDARSVGDVDLCRAFFETYFVPHRIDILDDDIAAAHVRDRHDGFVTGYFEPEIDASEVASDAFPVPVYRRPPNLVEIDDATRPPHIAPHFFFARKDGNSLQEFPDRQAIEEGCLEGRELELFWCRSRIDLFFVQIQGSARLRMPDGSIRRISYDGKSGHPFTAIGRELINRGELDPDTVSMQSIRRWLEMHPGEAAAVMQLNRSYIFFQEIDHPAPAMGPVAAAGVALTAGRSLAVDHRLHTFGTPVFVETADPLPGNARPFRHLMVAQDTGSAIVGPARGDLFMGSGDDAGLAAGAIRHPARFTILIPDPKSG